jgi:pimeloyl-ACP methyl ester carboxylesterase
MAERLSLPPNQTNWVGHSWGALVGYQFGTNHSEHRTTIIPVRPLNSYVALDPADDGPLSSGLAFGDVYRDHSAATKNATGRNGRTLSLVGVDNRLLRANLSGSIEKAESADLSIIARFDTGQIPSGGNRFDLAFVAIHSGVHRVYAALLEASSAPTAMIRPTNIARQTGPTFYWRPNQFNDNGKHKNNSLFDGVIDVSLETLSSGSVTQFEYVPSNQAQPQIFSVGRSFGEP